MAVSRIINNFAEREITVIDDQSGMYHVSGHANRPDLVSLHQILKPKVIIPMHGEQRHLFEHKNLAHSNNFDSVVVPNGSILQISSDGTTQIVDEISVGRIYLDGGRLVKETDGVLKARLQMANRGHLAISLLIEKNDIVRDGIWVKSKGLPQSKLNENEMDLVLEEALELELMNAKDHDLYDDDFLESLVKRVCNKVCQKMIGKKPVVTIFINRID